MNIQAVNDLLHKAERLSMAERLLLIERLAEGIRQDWKLSVEEAGNDIASACGILQAPHSVSLGQMETVIRERGSRL
jgi:hypothetical protein